MTKETIILIAITIVAFVILFLLYKYRKEYLKVIAYYAVIQAEDLYSNGHGKEKLIFAIKQVKTKLPWYLAWLMSEKLITGIIESALSSLQSQFKKAKNDKIEALNEIIKVGINSKDVNTVITTAQDMKNGYIEGYAEACTDFKGNSSGVVGVKAGLKL